jgi:hypothetical protein
MSRVAGVLDDVQVVIVKHRVFAGVVLLGQQRGQVQLFLFTEVVEDWRVV